MCLGPAGDGFGRAFPARPIHVYVPFAPGNTLDNALRQVADEFRRTPDSR